MTDLIPQLGTETFSDSVSASKWLVYSLSQWISYDDNQTFADKTRFIHRRCLRGLAVWSLDLDTPDWQGLTAIMGETAMVHGFVDDQLNPEEKKQLVSDLAAYTGQNCYVTQACDDGSQITDVNAHCRPGYMSVAIGHYPQQIDAKMILNECKEGQYHHVCCPTRAMPQNCKWQGAPERNEFGCDGASSCGGDQYELTRDTFVDAEGKGSCFTGFRGVSYGVTRLLV